MKAQTIFNEIQSLNSTTSTISSVGTFVGSQNQQVADMQVRETMQYLPENSLAYKIIIDNRKSFTEKQLWVIAFELLKNEEYCAKLDAEISARVKKSNAKIAARDFKLMTNKENSQDVLDFVKKSGKKLADYYNFLKSNKRYAREFYSKNFSIETATEFINL